MNCSLTSEHCLWLYRSCTIFRVGRPVIFLTTPLSCTRGGGEGGEGGVMLCVEIAQSLTLRQ